MLTHHIGETDSSTMKLIFVNFLMFSQFDFNLYLQLATSPRGATIIKGVYAYKLTKTDWVYRIWLPLLKVRGWSPQKYYDGSGSRASALRKVNLQAYAKNQNKSNPET